MLPPGQSGFISQDGSTQSPHLYDQTALFTSFQWKPALFGQPGATETPRVGVSIVRDSYGVPAATAASDADAWWGAGYAVAQDRLTELELFRRQASGRLAEIFGAGMLDDDIASRRDFYTPSEVDAQVARLPERLRARLQSYTDGVSGGESRTERLCRTRHGPVESRAGSLAYARRYAIWNRELETIIGIAALNDADDIQDVDDAVAAMTWNENIMAADSDGNVGYWHPGLLPLRPLKWDERLPYPGTGEAEWRGFLPVVRRPHVINPPGQPWLANWNNRPSYGWTSGDLPARETGAGPYHRATYLFREAAGFSRKPSVAALRKLIGRTGTTAQQRPIARTRLRAALEDSTGSARTMLSTILAWDGSYHRTDGNGTVDPGVAAWEQLKATLQATLVKRLGGAGAQNLAGATSANHQFDITNGEATALRTFSVKDVRKAAAASFAALAKTFGSSDPAAWREPRRIYTWNLQGIGSPPPLPFFDRGTWEQLVELR